MLYQDCHWVAWKIGKAKWAWLRHIEWSWASLGGTCKAEFDLAMTEQELACQQQNRKFSLAKANIVWPHKNKQSLASRKQTDFGLTKANRIWNFKSKTELWPCKSTIAFGRSKSKQSCSFAKAKQSLVLQKRNRVWFCKSRIEASFAEAGQNFNIHDGRLPCARGRRF